MIICLIHFTFFALFCFFPVNFPNIFLLMGYLYHMLKSETTSKFHQIFLLSLLIHLLFFSPQSVTGQQGDGVVITLLDFQLLLAVKRELIDLRGPLRSWNGTRNGACSGSWTGIKCVKGQVIAIQLPFKALGGRISSKIGLLKQLRRVSLHDNLIGGTIPPSLGLLPNLRGLYLFNNRLSGLIPPSIGYSPQLQAIDLSNNFLSGFIPPTLVKSPKIYRLNLSFNSLSGPIPPSFSLPTSLTFLALQHNNISGPIPDSWSNGDYQLRSLTLDYNSLSGTIPHFLGKLGNLKELSLSHNMIHGSIPDEISTLLKLQVLDLSNNGINGSFPRGLDGNLSSIVVLDLSQNNLTGEIPASLDNLSNLTSFNVSYNDLSGQVPSRLAKEFNSSSFVGNLQLCGFSSSSPCLSQGLSPASESKPNHHRKLSTKDIILIVVGALLVIMLVLCCILLCCLIRKRTGSKSKNGNSAGAEKGAVAEGGSSGEAEIMGKCPYGTVYKATLEDGNQVTVKRLREKLAKSPTEFEIEVAALGRIRHPYLLPLRAYYLGPKKEKLLVFDYLSKGSLSSFLHARGPEIAIDWPTRMKIALGIANGLNHLHTQENLIHGNLTSSEVHLDEHNNPKISDYGIHRLMTDTANTSVTATAGSSGYRAPELQKTKKATMKTDIYSLGVIILELLTGKSPSEAIDGSELPQWAASTVKEEWSNEVFDLELMRDVSTRGDEMLSTLKLALCLVDPSPDARLEAQQVLQQLEEINPKLAAEAATDEFAGKKTHH